MCVGSLVKVLAKCVPGAKIVDLCAFGDAQLLEGTAAVYHKTKNGKKIAKGRKMRDWMLG